MLKWTCPTGDQWDRFLLDPEMTECKELEQHLTECSVCRFLVAQRRQSLEELGTIWHETARPQCIRLLPLEIPDSTEEPIARLLAAKGNGDTANAEAVTLSSADRSVLLRAIRDSHTKEVWLYVAADEPNMYRNVVVKPFDADKEYLTDEQGRVNLGVIDWPEPEKLTAEVHLPKATFTMTPLTEFGGENKPTELRSSAGDRISVILTGEGRNRRLEIQVLEISQLETEAPLKIAVRGTGTEGALRVGSVSTDRVTFEDIEIPGKLEIYLYQ